MFDLDRLTNKATISGSARLFSESWRKWSNSDNEDYPAPFPTHLPIPARPNDLQVSYEENCTVRGFKVYIRVFCKSSITETSSKGQRGKCSKSVANGISLKFTGFLGYVFDSCTDFPTLWNYFKWCLKKQKLFSVIKSKLFYFFYRRIEKWLLLKFVFLSWVFFWIRGGGYKKLHLLSTPPPHRLHFPCKWKTHFVI